MITKQLKKRRKALKVSQKQLAALAEISVNTLYKIETGKANPTLEILNKIAETLGMEICVQLKTSQKYEA